jgi:hypothetical protein
LDVKAGMGWSIVNTTAVVQHHNGGCLTRLQIREQSNGACRSSSYGGAFTIIIKEVKTTMANPIISRSARVRAALERRYPDLFISVDFIAHSQGGTYKGWRVSFESRDPRALVRYNLASGLSDFGGDGGNGNTEFVGCRWYAFGAVDNTKRYRIGYHIEEEAGDQRDRALTKKMQTQVMRLLKPFIRGTWTAPAVRT